MQSSVVFGFLFGLIACINATSVNFVNRCGGGIQVIKTENGRGPVQECYLNPGANCWGNYNGAGMNFKSGWGGQTLAEFSFNMWNNVDFYDLSVIVGYDVAMQISSNAPGAQTVTCTWRSCPDAYLYPSDNTKTHGTSTGHAFTVTFCP